MEQNNQAAPAKAVAESRTEQVQIILNSHINGNKRLFGGKLMEWIDTVGAVVARRHSGREVTTACIDNLQFRAAVVINSTVVLIGKMTYVGRTSMEVRVDTFVEHLDGQRELVNTAYMVFVALDEHQRPVAVPKLLVQNEQERYEFESGARRQQLRKERRHQGY
ncbi:MAG TPA: acyl-CoA thioesterase [Candidatus Gallacutalibacter stercoravium]|nr:acyl-CoA thioesterase [Candidatus Gallacutalibacter stercoravium]